MDKHVERAARNEALFRQVNERIKETNERFSGADGEFHCECSHAGCDRMITMTFDEYEVVRANPRRFALIDGHEDLAIERVVGRTDRFATVEKIGEGSDVAEALDPRR